MKIDIVNIKGESVGRSIELPENIFGIEPNDHAIYLNVKQFLANQRQGTHKSKERNEVAGSTRKLHKQKGTGGSRKGDIKNPLYRGGGRIFGPRPRNYNVFLNKKLKDLARRSAMSYKATEGQIMIVEDFSFDTPKTKEFLSILKALKLDNSKVLFVTNELDKNVYLSSRNLRKSKVTEVSNLNTYDVLNANTLIISEKSIEKLSQVEA